MSLATDTARPSAAPEPGTSSSGSDSALAHALTQALGVVARQSMGAGQVVAAPLAQFLDMIPAGVCVWDAAGQLAFHNARAVELWGRTPRALGERETCCAGLRLFRHDGTPLAPEEHPLALSLREGRAFHDSELQAERADGTRFQGSFHCDVLRDESGHRLGAMAVFQDVTPQKRAELSLRRQREVLAQIVEGAPLEGILEALTRLVEEASPRKVMAAILVLDPDGRHLRWAAGSGGPAGWRGCLENMAVGPNAGCCGTAAYRREPVFVTDIAQDPRWADLRAEAAKNNVRAGWSSPILAANGQVLGTFAVYYFEPAAPASEEIELVQMLTRTAAIAIGQRGGERAFRASEARFRAIVDQASTGVVQVDLTGHITLCNQRFCAFLGYTDAELIGRHLTEVTHPDDRAVSVEHFRRLLADGPDFVVEKRYVRKDGAVVWATSNVSATRDSSGKLQHSTAVILDITARKRAERNTEFLDRLSRNLAPLSAPEEMVRHACDAVGRHLDAHRAFLLEWQDDLRHVVARHDWHGEGAPSLAGTYDGERFGPESLRQRMRQGSVAIEDVERDEEALPFVPTYRALHVRALATARFAGAQQSAVTLVVAANSPRAWSADDRLLLENALARIWPLVERARADEKARAVVQRLTLAMKAGRLGDWRWEAASEMVTLAGVPAEIIGVPSGTALPRERLRGLLHPDDAGPARRMVEEAMANGREYHMEYRLRRPSGEYVWLAVHGAPVTDEQGRLSSVVGVMQDISALKEAQARLQAQEARLRLLSANAPVILSHWTREHRLLFASNAFAERWKTSPETLLGKTVPEVLGDEAWKTVQPYVERVLNGEPVSFEMDVPYDGIGSRYVKVSYSPDVAADGAVQGYFSAVTDISDRRRAEIALRDSEERLRLAMQTGKLGVWSWDIVENRVTWTDSLYEIHGVKPSEFDPTLEGFAVLIHPEDRLPVQRAIHSTLEHNTPYELEFRAVRPGGAIIWVFANGVVMRDGAGRAVRMLGATFDITARKTAELALRESESRFRALASHAPVGIFLTDPNGECLFVNESWRAMSGLAPEQARGLGWMRALHPDDRERVITEWNASVSERRPFAAEYRFQRPDGSTLWLQGSAVEFRNASGGAKGYIGTVADITKRKAAEDALRESEKRFRTLASHAPVGIFLTDPQGATLLVNESWSAMTGLTLETARGDGWVRAIHPEDRARVTAEWEEAVRRGVSSTAEYRFLRADGAITWVQGNAVQLRDDAGRPAGYIGTIADFTERKRVEEKLREGEERFRTLADNIAQFAWMTDATGRHRWINRRFMEFAGLTAEQIDSGGVLPLHHPDHAERVIEKYQRHLERGEAWEDLFPLKGRDGEYRWFLSRAIPIRDAAGRVTRWFGTNTDVTQLRETEAALQKQNERLQLISEALASLLDAKDPTAIVHELLPRVAQHLGADAFFNFMVDPAAETLTLHAYRGISDEAARSIQRIAFGEAICGTVAKTGEAIHAADIQNSGDPRVALMRQFGLQAVASNPFIVDNRLIGTLSFATRTRLEFRPDELEFMRSISRYVALAIDRARARQTLQAHADELEHRVQERTASLREAILQMEEFSYSVSHDLRAPLRAMNAYAQALVEDYGRQLDDTARDYLERIRRSSVRMERLTHDVLTYSRIARTEMSLVAVDPRSVIGDLVNQYAELQAPRTRVDVLEPILPVRGHEVSLGQCLANLLTNAAKFVAPEVQPHIRVRTERVGPSVRIWIEDNGIGIDPHYQDRLFRVFERLPTGHPYDGTGIGLAIVRKAVEKMGGRCGVESDGTNGSRFWIELPPA